MSHEDIQSLTTTLNTLTIIIVWVVLILHIRRHR